MYLLFLFKRTILDERINDIDMIIDQIGCVESNL